MKLTDYDYQYGSLLNHIITIGENHPNRTGIDAISVPQVHFEVDLSNDIMPILGSKFVPFKTAVKEMLWIWQKQSNDVRELQEMGVHVWDEWMREDGTIGKAYGYQLRKFDQVNKLIKTLKEDPHNRRMVVTLWNNADLDDMSLQPCAFETLWNVHRGRLNCTLIQRSGDVGLGVPFNTLQYAVLVCMIAQCTGLQPGNLYHFINDAHIYSNHRNTLLKQLKEIYAKDVVRKDERQYPKLKLNPEIKDFYDFTIDDIILEDYTPGPKRPMEVAV